MTVPRTNTGGLVEYTKASERSGFKEFGKIAGRKLARCPTPSNRGYNKRLFVDCLPKTQVCAKPKGKVYGLKPAQCWKVNCEDESPSGDRSSREAPVNGSSNYKQNCSYKSRPNAGKSRYSEATMVQYTHRWYQVKMLSVETISRKDLN